MGGIIMGETNKELESSYSIDELVVENVLDKMLELGKERHKVEPIKIIICIFGGISALCFIVILCYRILIKTDISFESILSTMLAFFSIFISIFFYFKADETSTNFYKSSYNIMKDVSVTLGKIEERFGEKLNSLNDKITHLDAISSEKNAEIQEQKQEQDKVIQNLLNQTKLSEAEKQEYINQLNDYEKRIEELKAERALARSEAEMLRSKAYSDVGESHYISSVLLRDLMRGRTEFSTSTRQRLIKYNYMDENGNIDKPRVLSELARRRGGKIG